MHKSNLSQTVQSIQRNGVALKGILYTPVQKTTPSSLNVALRKQLDIFASVSLIKNLDGNYKARHSGVDIALIRENTEGEYSGLEHTVSLY